MQNIDEALSIHLLGNHYPQVSLDFIPICKEAIEHCSLGCYDIDIKMPNGITKSAADIVEGLHLNCFINEA
ncbi:MAG: hypothetical protein ACXQTI_08215 [Candidatus Nezhaarchaeales archaeon]